MMFHGLRPGVAYLDSAATTLTPSVVVDAVASQLRAGGTAGRSVHRIGRSASNALESVRSAAAHFVGGAPEQIAFVRSTTEGLNLLARGIEDQLGRGDRVLIDQAAHHSALLPFTRLCETRGAELSVIKLDARGSLDLDDFERRFDERVRAVVVTHVSNVTGAETPIAELASRMRAQAKHPTSRPRLIVDGAQAAANLPIDVSALGCDDYVFSGHKMYGPPGAGVVWSRRFSETTPLLLGGGIVSSAEPVSLLGAPHVFEAGTLDLPAICGLGAAMEFVKNKTASTRASLADTAASRLEAMDGVRVLGAPSARVGCVSFVVEGAHPHDVGTICDEQDVLVRVGHLCAEPMVRALGVSSVIRASFGVYNDLGDIDRLEHAIKEAQRVLRAY